jgi:hypothetical protein
VGLGGEILDVEVGVEVEVEVTGIVVSDGGREVVGVDTGVVATVVGRSVGFDVDVAGSGMIVGWPGRWSLRVIDGQVPTSGGEEFEDVVTVEDDDSDVLLVCGLGSVLPNCDESGGFDEDEIVEVSVGLLDCGRGRVLPNCDDIGESQGTVPFGVCDVGIVSDDVGNGLVDVLELVVKTGTVSIEELVNVLDVVELLEAATGGVAVGDVDVDVGGCDNVVVLVVGIRVLDGIVVGVYGFDELVGPWGTEMEGIEILVPELDVELEYGGASRGDDETLLNTIESGISNPRGMLSSKLVAKNPIPAFPMPCIGPPLTFSQPLTGGAGR